MTPTRKRSIIVGVIVGIIVAIPIGYALSSGSSVQHVDFNQANANKLPTDVVTKLDGSKVALRSLTGQPTVVNFWQEACQACRKEMPALESVHQAMGTKVRFVGVDGGDELSVVKDYVAKVGVTYQIVRDPRYVTAEAMSVKVYPATFLVAADGSIIRAKYGEITANELTTMLHAEFGL